MLSARSLLGGSLLGLGWCAPRVEASPYVTHRPPETTTEASPEAAARPDLLEPGWVPLEASPTAPLPRINAFGSPTNEALRVTFDPGVVGALHASLPRSLPSPVHPIAIRQAAAAEMARPAPLTLQNKHTVPEPASIVLLVTGAIGLAARRHLLRHRP